MTSKWLWDTSQSTEDLGAIQDTFLLMSSSEMNPLLKLSDGNADKLVHVTAPKDPDTTTGQQPAADQGIVSNPNVDGAGDASIGNAGEPGPSGVGGGAGGGQGGGGSGDRPEGQPKDASSEEGSHEQQQSGESTSTSSGSVPVLVSPPNPLVALQPEPWINAQSPSGYRSDANGHHHSEDSGYSQATTAVVSDNEGQWPSSANVNPLFVGSGGRQPDHAGADNPSTSDWSATGQGNRNDNLDASSAASTLSPFTNTQSSNEKDKRSSSSSVDTSVHMDTSKSDVSLFDTSVPSAIDDGIANFQMSQDMFADPENDDFTSTPSGSGAILGFSRNVGPINTSMCEESDMIIPPSLDQCGGIPFLVPSTPTVAVKLPGFQSMDTTAEKGATDETLKRSLPDCLRGDTNEIPAKKFAQDVISNVTSTHFLPVAPPTAQSEAATKRPSERQTAKENILKYMQRNLRLPDPSSTPGFCQPVTLGDERLLGHEVELSPVRPGRSGAGLLSLPQSSTISRQITFESATSQSSSATSSSSPGPDVSTASVSRDVTSTSAANVSSTSDDANNVTVELSTGDALPTSLVADDLLEASAAAVDVSATSAGSVDLIADSECLSQEPRTALENIFGLDFCPPSAPEPPGAPSETTTAANIDTTASDLRLQRTLESIEQQLIRVSTSASPAKEFQREPTVASPTSGRLYRMKPRRPASQVAAPRSPAPLTGLIVEGSALLGSGDAEATSTLTGDATLLAGVAVEESEVPSSTMEKGDGNAKTGAIPETQTEPIPGGDADSCVIIDDNNDGMVLHYSPLQETQSQYFNFADSPVTVDTVEKGHADAEATPAAPLHPLLAAHADAVETSKTETTTETPSGSVTVAAVIRSRKPLNIDDIPLGVNDAVDGSPKSASPPPSFHLTRPLLKDEGDCLVVVAASSTDLREGRGETSVTGDTPTIPPVIAETMSSDDLNPFDSEPQPKPTPSVKDATVDVKCPPAADLSTSGTEDQMDSPICPSNRNKRPANWSGDAVDVDVERAAGVKCPKISDDFLSSEVSIQSDAAPAPVIAVETNAVTTVETGLLPPNIEVETPDGPSSKEATAVMALPVPLSEVCHSMTPTSMPTLTNQVRRTVIIKRIVIEEVIKNGIVVQKRTEEIQEDPVVTIFSQDGIEFLQPTPPSPKGSVSKSNSSVSSMSKSFSSGSLGSGWLGDVSSSRSSGSSAKLTPCPRSGAVSGGEMTTPAMEDDSVPVRTENRAVGGMKTLRSVRRRQCYEIRKSLNLSTVDSTPEDVPEPTHKKAGVPPITIVIGTSGAVQGAAGSKSGGSPSKSKKKTASPRKRATKGEDSSSSSPSPKKRSTPAKKKKPTPRPKKGADGSATVSKKKSPTASKVDTEKKSGGQEKLASKPSVSNFREQNIPFSPDRYWDSTRPLQPGVRVMAQWRDGYYYPGLALEPDKDDRWKVLYDDGDTRSIRIGNILVIDVLPIGQSIYAQSPDDYYDSGIITQYYEEEDTTGYVIEIDGGLHRRVPRSQVILTHDQAACLETVPQASLYAFASISLENIVDGRRRSRMDSEPSSPVATATRSPRTPRRKVIPTYKDAEEEEKDVVENEVASGGSSSSSKTGRTPKRKK